MSEISNFLLFGGETLVGQDIIRRGVLEELEVGVYALQAEKVPEGVDEDDLTIIRGDILDKDELEDAMQGYDAVIVAMELVGWGVNSTNALKAIRNIIQGMKKHNITKLAVLSSGICLPGYKGLFAKLKRRWHGYSVHKDVLSMLEDETDSIEWIVMMAPKIVNSRRVSPEYKVERNKMPGEWSVNSGELADFMVKVFMDRTSRECFRHNKLGISTRPHSSLRMLRWVVPVAMIVTMIAVAVYGGRDILPLPLKEFVDNILDPEMIEEEEEKSTLRTVASYLWPW